jgi:hypothetical protein
MALLKGRASLSNEAKSLGGFLADNPGVVDLSIELPILASTKFMQRRFRDTPDALLYPE